MAASSSSFREGSPVLGKPSAQQVYVVDNTNRKLNLEHVHKRLLQHLKKKDVITKKDLKMYYIQFQKMNPEDHKSRWTLMKIKGLLSYILKKQRDFQFSLVNGEITVFEKTFSQKDTSMCELPGSQLQTQATDSFDFPSDLLTNNNFVDCSTQTAITQSDLEMEVENEYSKDLFGDDAEVLHGYAQENYDMFKQLLTYNPQVLQSGEDDDDDDNNKFKIPPAMDAKINKAHQLHESLEQEYNVLMPSSSTSQMHTDDIVNTDDEMGEPQKKHPANRNPFDDLTITNEELKEEFKIEFEQTENWMSELINSLINIKVSEKHTHGPDLLENTNVQNESTSSIAPLETHYSEENLRIIREVREEFRKNLDKDIQKNTKLEILRDLLNSSD